eukprot:2381647-Karenia_brevis.AAC.1
MVAGTANFESPTGAACPKKVGAAEPRVDEKAANLHLSQGDQDDEELDESKLEEHKETSDEDGPCVCRPLPQLAMLHQYSLMRSQRGKSELAGLQFSKVGNRSAGLCRSWPCVIILFDALAEVAKARLKDFNSQRLTNAVSAFAAAGHA